MTNRSWQEWGITPLAAVVARAKHLNDTAVAHPWPWDRQTDAIKAGFILEADRLMKQEDRDNG